MIGYITPPRRALLHQLRPRSVRTERGRLPLPGAVRLTVRLNPLSYLAELPLQKMPKRAILFRIIRTMGETSRCANCATREGRIGIPVRDAVFCKVRRLRGSALQASTSSHRALPRRMTRQWTAAGRDGALLFEAAR